jgi:hypothetical protein
MACQPNLSLVDHLAQHHAPVAKRLYGELDIHFRDGLHDWRPSGPLNQNRQFACSAKIWKSA